MSKSELICIKEEEVIREVRLGFSICNDQPIPDSMLTGPLSGSYLDLELIDSLIEIVGTREFEDIIFSIINMNIINAKDLDDMMIFVKRAYIAKEYIEFRDLNTQSNEFVLIHLLCFRMASALREDFFNATQTNYKNLDSLIQFLVNYVVKLSHSC